MAWYQLLFYLDQLMWYMQQVSTAVIFGWFLLYLGKRFVKKYRDSEHRFWRFFFARRL